MAGERPLVVVAEELDPVPAAWLAERAEVVACSSKEEPRFSGLLGRAEGLVVRTYTKVDAAMLGKGPRLKVVGRAGVAVESIDVKACRARGVRVVHTPGANTRAVVEYVSALIADATRPRVYLDEAVAAERWHRIRREEIAPRQLDEMTLGIWGFGRIGSAVARVGAALNMRVIYNELVEIPAERRAGARPVGVDELLRESDVLSVHVDNRPGNRHLVNAAACGKMKPDVVFINTSRGLVVDPGAVRGFLLAHPAARAMIDVHDPFEPMTPEYPLLGVANARLSPHLASGTETAKRNMSWVVRDVWRVIRGEEPEFEAAPT